MRVEINLVHGRSGMWQEEADLLTEVCKMEGDHVEIGSLWGASAIIAARSKPRPGRIYTIDMMCGGYWIDGDPGTPTKEVPSARSILDNFMNAGVADRITLICAGSDPLPLKDVRPSTALIDAAHGETGVRADWVNLSRITTRFIAFHDYHPKYPGVLFVVDKIAMQNPHWKPYKQAHSLFVLERIVEE